VQGALKLILEPVFEADFQPGYWATDETGLLATLRGGPPR
jgi:hypothetical protein